jgi:uncharacterized protein YjgD (DUF1641 family)
VNTSVQNQLEQPEIQEAIVSFLKNLPAYEKQLQQIGQYVNFGKEILADKEVLQPYDQLFRTYDINLKTLEAILELLEKLPRLNKMIEQLENILDFIQSIMHDEATTQHITDALKEYAHPIVEKGKSGMSLLKEIQQRAESAQEPIKLITIYKWLKDPAVQKVLQYVQATLSVLNKKS